MRRPTFPATLHVQTPAVGPTLLCASLFSSSSISEHAELWRFGRRQTMANTLDDGNGPVGSYSCLPVAARGGGFCATAEAGSGTGRVDYGGGAIATMGKYHCYVVIKGRSAGIYTTWEDCKAQVDGYPSALYWGCHSEEETVEALSRNNSSKTSRSTQAILEKFKRPEVVQNQEAPLTPPATPTNFDDWKIIKNLVGLLLIALITLVVVMIAVVVKLFLM